VPAVNTGAEGDGCPAAVRTLGFWDSLTFLFCVVVPTWSKGILLRRPSMMKLAARRDLDTKAVRVLQRFRRIYGEGALAVRKPGRLQVIVMSPADVTLVLKGASDTFSPASREKKAALAHFEPRNSLITTGSMRAERRDFHEEVLESRGPVHHLAARFREIVREEVEEFLTIPDPDGSFGWARFTEGWHRSVRRIVLGDGARHDRNLTEMLAALRGRANWVWLPPRRRLRLRFHARLIDHLARGEAGSLAETVLKRQTATASVSNQVTQWLFAFDAGGIATWRTLALLASHPDSVRQAREEATSKAAELTWPLLRACFIESVRLYPTTPVVLREAAKDVCLGDVGLPQGSGVIIYAPFFHRDDERRADANAFRPELWVGRDPADALPSMPFSAGPAACPGRHLVSLAAGAWLAALLSNKRFELRSGANLRPGALPGTLDHFGLRFG
jgi:cytochrome P450